MLGITLTESQEGAIRRLIKILDEAEFCYQFTGGFAGNLHGSSWPLHDLDIDVAKKDLPRLAQVMQPYACRPLAPYEDEEFKLHLMQAKIEGVQIDIAQAEEAFGWSGGKWIPLETDLSHRQMVPLLDMQVCVIPLDALIAYKELIGRTADVADLREIRDRRL